MSDVELVAEKNNGTAVVSIMTLIQFLKRNKASDEQIDRIISEVYSKAMEESRSAVIRYSKLRNDKK